MTHKSDKLEKIAQIENGRAVSVVECFSNASNNEDFCWENAMLYAIKESLTNVRHGSPKGIMRNGWNKFEIKNFGTMLLYYVLRQCLVEIPYSFYLKDL